MIQAIKHAIGRVVFRTIPFVPANRFLINCIREYLQFQLSGNQALLITKTIKQYSGCRLLVFGAGNDTGFWLKLNKRGKTVFLEDMPAWFQAAQLKYPKADIRLIEYNTHLSDWQSLLDRPDKLLLNLPEDVINMNWDVIIVDGPRGYGDGAGRMKSIAASARLAKRSSVFVHDCERQIESVYCDTYLGTANLITKKFSRNGSELRQYYIHGL